MNILKKRLIFRLKLRGQKMILEKANKNKSFQFSFSNAFKIFILAQKLRFWQGQNRIPPRVLYRFLTPDTLWLTWERLASRISHMQEEIHVRRAYCVSACCKGFELMCNLFGKIRMWIIEKNYIGRTYTSSSSWSTFPT